MLTPLAAIAAVILLPAHAAVTGTTPADGAVMTEQPGTFSVTMNEELLTIEGVNSANQIQLTDAEGRFYGDGCTTVEGGTISLAAALGTAGDYTLTYQVVSADGHTIDGTVGFAFEPVAGQEGVSGLAAAPVCGVAAPVETEAGATDPAATEPAATSDAPDATASTTQGTAAPDEQTDEGAEGGEFPFLPIGILALLAVLGVIAYTVNRGYRRRRDDAA
ncbi:copper resistance CopC family protein [Agrococcus beijingensis]|uniref:copper resistance CopC family protein n=1 Tax=Agrococcus beijingensis TaxID=3068634 RepID=UPI002740617D|nr:copper resistance CopC family protein [Agrococcus sp. REN33]